MKECIFLSFVAGTIFYLLSATLAAFRFTKIRNIVFLTGTAAMLLSLSLRVYYNLPLMCLFQEPYIIVFAAGLITIYLFIFKYNDGLYFYSGAIAFLLALVTLFMPGDIYVSFRQTNSLFAHIFSFLSSFARAFYLCAGAMALRTVIKGLEAEKFRASDNTLTGNMIIAGYCLHSVGMFSGGLWSYTGYGNPVQWQSHIFLGMAGVWLYYSWYLHFRLSSGRSSSSLSYSALAGGIVTFIFSFIPDTGKFNIPGIFQ